VRSTRYGAELQQAAAVLALGHCSPENYALIPEELTALKEECTADRKVLLPLSATALALLLDDECSQLVGTATHTHMSYPKRCDYLLTPAGRLVA